MLAITFTRLLMRAIIRIFISILMITPALAAESNVQSIAAFKEGLNVANVLACEQKFQDLCPLAKANDGEALAKRNDCLEKQMSKDNECEQAYAIRKYSYYPAEKIKKYGQISVFFNTTMADGIEVFYMVDTNGNLISLTDQVDLVKNKQYQKIIKKHRKAELTTMLDWTKTNEDLFPRKKVTAKGEEIIFKQSLRDGGCVACATVGVAEVAYLFSQVGIYQGAKVVSVKAVKR